MSGGLIAAAAVTAVAGYASSRSAAKAKKDDQKHDAEMTAEESALAAQRTGYEKALEYHYKQEDRFQAQRGLDEFRKFSTMGQWAPGYSDVNARIAKPVMPTYGDFVAASGEQEEGAPNPVTNATGGNAQPGVVGQNPADAQPFILMGAG